MPHSAVEIRGPAPADIEELVAHMRDQDVEECRAAGHTDLQAVVEEGVRISDLCWVARIDGRLAAIFGVAPLTPDNHGVGVPWLLGTEEIPKHRRIFARLSRPYIRAMQRTRPHLVNVVHARNTVSVEWLTRMGFTLQPAIPYGPHGEPFHVFEMKNV